MVFSSTPPSRLRAASRKAVVSTAPVSTSAIRLQAAASQISRQVREVRGRRKGRLTAARAPRRGSFAGLAFEWREAIAQTAHRLDAVGADLLAHAADEHLD